MNTTDGVSGTSGGRSRRVLFAVTFTILLAGSGASLAQTGDQCDENVETHVHVEPLSGDVVRIGGDGWLTTVFRSFDSTCRDEGTNSWSTDEGDGQESRVEVSQHVSSDGGDVEASQHVSVESSNSQVHREQHVSVESSVDDGG
ncbi:hypothetical protein ACFQH6_13820 [Halobacteriaceae archaeon GCM10025711]